MIFGSLGLLVLSLMLLIFGITRTSLTLLVMALCAAGLASVLLIAAYQAHKMRLAAAGGGSAAGTGGAPVGAIPAAMPAGAQAVYFVPVGPGGQPLIMGAGAPAMAGAGAGAIATGGSNGGAPLVGYDAMAATQLVKLINSGALSNEQIEAIAQYESTHQQRKTVLQAVQGLE
jgi:hypothetical protein